MDNGELLVRLDVAIRTLEGIESQLGVFANRERVRQALQAAQEAMPQPRTVVGWPWTPATVTQGFLCARWLRRDGVVYGPGATPGAQTLNGPIRGGDDANARVDVPSGAPRVAPYGPT